MDAQKPRVKSGLPDIGKISPEVFDELIYPRLGGVYEIAKAAGLGVILDKDAVVKELCVFEICRLFGIDDPFSAISEGTLILTCRPHASDSILAALKARGITASVAGERVPESSGLRVRVAGEKRTFEHPGVDPFWKAFSLATA
jgi:hydrogenase maturation factor